MDVTTVLRGACLTAVLALSSVWAETTGPVFTTPVSGAPNPAGVAQGVTFTAVASSSKPLTYLWDFGDGRGDVTSAGSIVHQYTDPGTFTVTVTVTDGSSNNSSTTTETIIATPPVFTSPLTGVPNPAGTAQRVTFTAVASSAQFLLYNWDFGDGLSDTTFNGSIVHQYPKPGAYTVTVTASDGTLQTTSTTTETVNAPLVLGCSPDSDSGIDSDGDGFSDQCENELGSNPFDPNSTPSGNLPATPDRIHGIQSISGKWIVSSSSGGGKSKGKPKPNTLKMNVKLAAPAGFDAGDTILVDVAGIVRSFTLNNKGQATDGGSTLKASSKGSKKGLARVRAAAGTKQIVMLILLKDDQGDVTQDDWVKTLVKLQVPVPGPPVKKNIEFRIVVIDRTGIYPKTIDAMVSSNGKTATVTWTSK